MANEKKNRRSQTSFTALTSSIPIHLRFQHADLVFAVLPEGEYVLRLRLYEAEERLKQRHFVRISNSEIINLKKARSFDLSFTGTICVTLSDGSSTYVSRRYVNKIKEVLGI